MRQVALIVGLILLPFFAIAQEIEIPPSLRAAANRIKTTTLEADVNYLASDALRGRAAPSPGLDSATAFIIRRLSQLGLQPLGDHGTYLQHYRVRSFTTDTTASFIEIGGQRFSFGTDFLIQQSQDTGTVSAPVVYVGAGVRASKLGIDPYAGLDVKGKWLLAHGPAALPKNHTIESLGVIGVDWSSAVQEGMRRGARGVLYIPTARSRQRWNLLRGNPSLLSSAELDPPVASAAAQPTIPQAILSPRLVDLLLEGEPISGSNVLARGDTAEYYPSFALHPTKHVALTTSGELKTLWLSNILAQIPGSDPNVKEEAVTIAAHLDGAVGHVAVAGDSIYNAADDNASGSAALLSLADALMHAPRPKRSIILIWDTGEEVGLWGSRYLASNPPVPLKNIVAHFNVDMIGRTKLPGSTNVVEEELSGPDEVYITGPRVLSAAMDSLLHRANRAYLKLQLNHRYDVVNHEFFYPRSDATPFLERGVPIIEFFTGLHADYHMPSDEAQKLDIGKMEKITRTVLITAWLLANEPVRLTMDKGFPATVPRY